MKAKIVGGEFDGVEFQVSIETQREIEEKMDKYHDVKEYCRKYKVYGYSAYFVKVRSGNYVKVPLPNANDHWTFAAFDWVKKFCEHFKGIHYSYPEHRNSLDCATFLWIRVN